MTVYIALLRGINVGGNNLIKMAELRRMFETMGLERVQTYIQSGNVLFISDEREASLRQRIEQEFSAVFGFTVTVVLRTSAELEQIIGNCPFSEEAVREAEASSAGESLYVALLPEASSPEGVQRLSAYNSEREEYRIVGREFYLLFRNSVRNSKLAGNLHKLGVPATVRNWKTINKLYALAKAMES
ncbi:DUF1697 domain-containing protein [Brevibacillus humidisoli]|uniref:DUF1697 domain-containing protein n=1 Tax=Brevibacillus humidisoli TaxID=2895522 RepID=UPI001E541FFF|nr:DUF1697 domain-containing protein [Brevibacillus humidisoli]UFJ39552.1 DUF1697 domain-containing protein [Brevibacillus humidisoli]